MGSSTLHAFLRRGGELRRAPAALAFAAMSALLLAYVVVAFAGWESDSTLVNGWLVDAFELTAGCLCVARGLTRRTGRLIPLVLGAAVISWALGDVANTIQSLNGATPPVPSVADAFYLGFFPLAYGGIVLMMRGQARRLDGSSWLDGAVAGLGAAAVCAAFAFHDIVRLTGGRALEVAVNLAYPVGDLLLLFLIAGASAMLSGRRRAPWVLLATGVAFNVAGDTFNLFGSTVGATRVGSAVNEVAWPVAVLLISIAVWLPRGRSDPRETEKPPGFLLPALGALAALAILALAGLHTTSRVAIGLAVATLLVAGARLVVSMRGLRELTQRRYRQSVTDHLTGLGNRRGLFELLERHFAEHDPLDARPRLACLYADLNHFKELNDSFGHPAGDDILRQVGERLTSALRESDVLVRLGGDEFAIIALGVDPEGAVEIAERLTAALSEPFSLEVVSPRLSASIGIAMAPDHAEDSDGLLWCADAAMYRAKSTEAPFALYEERKDFDRGGNRMRMAEELSGAIAEGSLVLHYQPQLALDASRVRTVEALVRWPHERLGLVPPLTFIPIAEEAGLMSQLTAWVLESALAQCAAWRAAGHTMSVAVNVSATNLLEVGFLDLVRERLGACSLPPEALVIELTETSIIQDFERSRAIIGELRAIGIVVSIDDFGAGFTSLAYLSNLAVGELKLDRSFITRLAPGEPARGADLVRAMIDLGHALELRVVAEGVEDEATLRKLSSFGCDLAQGYYIEAPSPAESLSCINADASPPSASPEPTHPHRRARPSRSSSGAPAPRSRSPI